MQQTVGAEVEEDGQNCTTLYIYPFQPHAKNLQNKGETNPKVERIKEHERLVHSAARIHQFTASCIKYS